MEQDKSIEIRESIRKRAIAARDGLAQNLRQEFSDEIAQRLHHYLAGKLSRSIHCYISFRSEVETRAFIERELVEGMRITVPIIEQAGTSRVLGHTEVHGLTALAKGHFGIDEPIERNAAALPSLDAVIIPLVAFDRYGTRLGYGMGFYDKFLRELPREIERIGLAFSIQKADRIPPLEHDEPLDTIVTEETIIHVHG